MTNLVIILSSTNKALFTPDDGGELSKIGQIGSGVLAKIADHAPELSTSLILGQPNNGDVFEEVIKSAKDIIDNYQVSVGVTEDEATIFIVVTVSGLSGDVALLMPTSSSFDPSHIQYHLVEAAKVNGNSYKFIERWQGFPIFMIGMTVLRPYAAGLIEIQDNPILNGEEVLDYLAMTIVGGVESFRPMVEVDFSHTVDDVTSDVYDPGIVNPDNDRIITPTPVPDLTPDVSNPARQLLIDIGSRQFDTMTEVLREIDRLSLQLDLPTYSTKRKYGEDVRKSRLVANLFAGYGSALVNGSKPILFPPEAKSLLYTRVKFDYINDYLYIPLGNTEAAIRFSSYVPEWFDYYIGDLVLKDNISDAIELLCWYSRFSESFMQGSLGFFSSPYDPRNSSIRIPKIWGYRRGEWALIEPNDRYEFKVPTVENLWNFVLNFLSKPPLLSLARPYSTITHWS
jgi:hypothetical protein